MQQRICHGMTQMELAKKIGVSQRSVSMWENGEAVPRNTARIKLANAFGLSVNYFFSDESDVEAECDEKSKNSSDGYEDVKDIMNKLFNHYSNDVETILTKVIEYNNNKS